MSESALEIKLANYIEVQNEWAGLCALVKPSYFQAATWQSIWHGFGAKEGYDPKVLAIADGGQSVLMSSFVIGTTKILKFIPQTCAFLNTTGLPAYDVICQEGCQPLMREGAAGIVLDKFFECLVNTLKVKEIVANAIPATLIAALQQSCSKFGLELIEQQRSTHFWINLESLRLEKKTHLISLTQRSRGIIKKSIESYQSQFGDLKVEHANSVAEAKEWLDGLIKLNIVRLDSKNQNSSFSFPFLAKFQTELIEFAFPRNEIIMARISAGDALIGYIYGFLYNDFIYIYQAGFDFNLNSKLSPGLVSHHLLAQDALDRGIKGYDFLAGDYQYKRSLSNEEDELVWVRIRKPSLAFTLDGFLRKLKRMILK